MSPDAPLVDRVEFRRVNHCKKYYRKKDRDMDKEMIDRISALESELAEVKKELSDRESVLAQLPTHILKDEDGERMTYEWHDGNEILIVDISEDILEITRFRDGKVVEKDSKPLSRKSALTAAQEGKA